ncbi:flippase activity-associated protein Agl23 [Saliphagus infecundisoli]|uniref:Flippase activity-associated protein Agl23 n=1 Tax=Saliphagus infecundisoli TaxID=1849069 RepID=A0ABD5QEM0_9EURY|nr:flippase activity-associated protein Agl23 [Saliphagus infecundisoli]
MARGSRNDHTLPALLAIAALAVAVRLAFLGERVAHWDEGRVGYDILRYGATGLWEYRPIVHGPFLIHVNDLVFALLGPTDFAMRLVVAGVGGLLPLAAWLFRDHLRPLEVVSVGALLAASPILVYYSRFMRNDVLVATFMLFALGMAVRLSVTGRTRYLYAAALCSGLGFTTKENAVVYVVCWLGAGALLLDTALFRPDAARPTRALLRDRFARARDRIRSAEARRRAGCYAGHLLLATALFVAVLVVFYAPRTAGTGIGFERLASRPGLLPAVTERALSDFWSGIADWGGKSGEESIVERLTDYLPRFLGALVEYAPAISVLAVAGTLGERYFADRPRPIVMGFAYWGLVSLPGYALAMDIWATWALVHVLVPLAIPAGVALGWILETGLDAARDLRAGTGGRRAGIDAALAVAVVVLLLSSTVAVVGATAFDPTNTRTDGDHVVQYAQPNQELRAPLVDLEAVLEETGGPIVYYGEYAIDNESAAHRPPVGDRWTEGEDGPVKVEDNGNWYSRLPLPWYVERSGAEPASAHDREELDALLAEEPAAVVIRADRAGELPAMAGYVRTTVEMRSPGDETVFYLREDAVRAHADPAGEWTPAASETGGNGNP